MKHYFLLYFYIVLNVAVFSITPAALANEEGEIFEKQTTAISPNGELLAAFWFDSISIFNLRTGELTYQFDAKTDTPFVLTFSSDSSKLFSSGWNSVSVWDMQAGKLHSSKETTDNSNCGGFSNDQKNVYFDDDYNQFGQRQLTLVDASLKKAKRTIKNSARCKASPDQAFLALHVHKYAENFTLESSNLEIIDLNSLQTKNVLKGDEAVPYDEDMFFFDDNSKLLVRDYSYFHVWDLKDNTVIRSWDSGLDVDHVAVSGNRLLALTDQKMRIWDLLTEPSPIQSLALPKNHDGVISANLSSNGKLYAVTSYSESEKQVSVSIVETDTNTVKHKLGASEFIYGEKFIQNDTLLVLNSYPINVIDVETGKIKYQFSMPK